VKGIAILEARSWWSLLGSSLEAPQASLFMPFLNVSVFRLMTWFHDSSSLKSLGELGRLMHNVTLAEDFKAQDFVGFSAFWKSEQLDKHESGPGSRLASEDGWVETPINILLPADGVKHNSEADAPQFAVPGLFYQHPLKVLKTTFQEDTAEHFHFLPHQMFWKPLPDLPPEHIYSELYTADCFIMLWSDSTHLTSFGSASLWPMHVFW
jgi:hypothetical protein